MENHRLNSLATRWVLVAGTGSETGVPRKDVLAAQAIGRALARNRLGLVTGAWHGVDYIVTEAYLQELALQSLESEHYLIQIIPEGWRCLHKAGRIVRTPKGAREWLDPQKYADAVILIGGKGGTFDAWFGALYDGLPSFPLGGTSGDAKSAFDKTVMLWELIPVPGVKKRDFERLGAKIKSTYDADQVANHLIEKLLWPAIATVDSRNRYDSASVPSLFISYSRKDAKWIDRIRTLLRPTERQGTVVTWVDEDLRPGSPWGEQLDRMLHETQYALLLVSHNFLISDYIKEKEIPVLAGRVGMPGFRLFWTLLGRCDWQSVDALNGVEAVGSVNKAISEIENPADQQCRLMELVHKITMEIQMTGTIQDSKPDSKT